MDATDLTALRADYVTLLANACTIKRLPVSGTTHTSQGTPTTVATTYCNVFTPGQGTAPQRLTPIMQAALTIEQGRVIELPMNASMTWDSGVAVGNRVLKRNDKITVGTSEYTVMDVYADMSYQLGLIITAQKTV